MVGGLSLLFTANFVDMQYKITVRDVPGRCRRFKRKFMEMLFAICYNVRAFIANERLQHFAGKPFAGAEDMHRMEKAAAEGACRP